MEEIVEEGNALEVTVPMETSSGVKPSGDELSCMGPLIGTPDLNLLRTSYSCGSVKRLPPGVQSISTTPISTEFARNHI